MFSLVVAALLQASATLDSPAPVPTPSPTPTARPRLICHQGAQQTGSFFAGPRICHTADEWRRIERQESTDTNDLRSEMSRATH